MPFNGLHEFCIFMDVQRVLRIELCSLRSAHPFHFHFDVLVLYKHG